MSSKFYLFLKRAFDIFSASLALVVTLPIWLIAALGIFVSDPGPIFYRAARVGRDNRTFRMWKFRSMRVPKNDSERSEASFKADENRIFPFGSLIRKLKIDELPQLLNIIGGTMSVVGPRPASIDQVEIMRAGKYSVASKVRPGLTGPAALYDYIYGDSIEDPEEYKRLVLPTRLELEAYYPKRMSAGYDIKMIWYTVVAIIATVFGKHPEKIYNELTTAVDVDTASEVLK